MLYVNRTSTLCVGFVKTGLTSSPEGSKRCRGASELSEEKETVRVTDRREDQSDLCAIDDPTVPSYKTFPETSGHWILEGGIWHRELLLS